ncbi:retrovirus-related pol polyprotein from transposon TNT 1-94 [Tanacetum coccineum]
MLTSQNPIILGDPMLQIFHCLLLLLMTGFPDCSLVSGLRMFKTYDREPLSAHELHLEVAFQKNTCFIRNLESVDLLSGSKDTNLYIISLDDMLKTSLDEAADALIKCIKKIQVHLNATIQNVRLDNGTEFVNQTLHDFYENFGIYQTSIAGTPQLNDVVKRRNRTLVEASRTMLIFSKAPLFLWAEAINTTCYTQNHSLIRLRYNKTPYELMHDKKPDLSFLHVFGSLCYPTNDSEDLGKLNAKADIGPGLQLMTPVTSSSGLIPNTIVEYNIMGEPLSPDRVFDFPMDEPEPHHAYDLFALEPLPGYIGNLNNNNGWIMADMPLLGELGAEADKSMVGPLVDEIAEPVVEMEEQVIASVIDMEEDIAMLFGDGDFSDDDSEGFEDKDEVWEVNKEWLMAPVSHPQIHCSGRLDLGL